jgi:hypothetical protein
MGEEWPSGDKKVALTRRLEQHVFGLFRKNYKLSIV